MAVAISELLVLVGGLFVCRQAGLKKSAPWFGTLLVMPINYWYAFIAQQGMYYSMHMLLAFLVLGLAMCHMKKGRKGRVCRLALLALLGFYGGANGVRMISMLYAPMFVAAFFFAFWALKEHERLRDGLDTPHVRAFTASMSMMIGCALGYLLNTQVLLERYEHWRSWESVNMRMLRMEDLLHQIENLFEFFGYDGSYELFSLRGISNVAGLMLVLIGVYALVRLVMRRAQLAPEQRFLLSTAIVTLVMGMVINAVLATVLARYILIALFMFILMMFMMWETEPFKNKLLHGCVLAVIMGLFAYQTVDVLHYDMRIGKVNYEIAADWLTERGFTQGYANFWNGNTLTEASNGEIEVWCLADDAHWSELKIHTLCQEKRHLTEKPEGKIFLLLDEREYSENEASPISDHLIEKIAWSYYVFAFENADELYTLMGK